MENENEMVVKRLSVPLGLEELMESLTKEVLRKKPDDIYTFASEHFAQLLTIRDQSNYGNSLRRRISKSLSQTSNASIEGGYHRKAEALKIKSATTCTVARINKGVGVKSPAPKPFLSKRNITSKVDSNLSPRTIQNNNTNTSLLKSDKTKMILEKRKNKTISIGGTPRRGSIRQPIELESKKITEIRRGTIKKDVQKQPLSSRQPDDKGMGRTRTISKGSSKADSVELKSNKKALPKSKASPRGVDKQEINDGLLISKISTAVGDPTNRKDEVEGIHFKEGDVIDKVIDVTSYIDSEKAHITPEEDQKDRNDKKLGESGDTTEDITNVEESAKTMSLEKAATLIQSLIRSFLVRKKLGKSTEELTNKKQLPKENHHALIQFLDNEHLHYQSERYDEHPVKPNNQHLDVKTIDHPNTTSPFGSDVSPSHQVSEALSDKPNYMEEAATTIQSAWRGHRTRRSVHQLELQSLQKPTECDELPHQRFSAEDAQKAATVIQALFRGYIARKNCLSIGKYKPSFEETLPTLLEVDESKSKRESISGIPEATNKLDEDYVNALLQKLEDVPQEDPFDDEKTLTRKNTVEEIPCVQKCVTPLIGHELDTVDDGISLTDEASSAMTSLEGHLKDEISDIKDDVNKLKETLEGGVQNVDNLASGIKQEVHTGIGDLVAKSINEDVKKLEKTLSQDLNVAENTTRPLSKDSTTSNDSMKTVIFNDNVMEIPDIDKALGDLPRGEVTENELKAVKEQSDVIVNDVLDSAATKIQHFFKDIAVKKKSISVESVKNPLERSANVIGDDQREESKSVVTDLADQAATTIQKTYKGYRVRRDLKGQSKDVLEQKIDKEVEVDKEITRYLKTITDPIRRAFSADKPHEDDKGSTALRERSQSAKAESPEYIYIPLRQYTLEEKVEDVHEDDGQEEAGASKLEDQELPKEDVESHKPMEQTISTNLAKPPSVPSLKVETDNPLREHSDDKEDHKNEAIQKVPSKTEGYGSKQISEYIDSIVNPVKLTFSPNKRLEKVEDPLNKGSILDKVEPEYQYIPLRDYSVEDASSDKKESTANEIEDDVAKSIKSGIDDLGTTAKNEVANTLEVPIQNLASPPDFFRDDRSHKVRRRSFTKQGLITEEEAIEDSKEPATNEEAKEIHGLVSHLAADEGIIPAKDASIPPTHSDHKEGDDLDQLKEREEPQSITKEEDTSKSISSTTDFDDQNGNGDQNKIGGTPHENDLHINNLITIDLKNSEKHNKGQQKITETPVENVADSANAIKDGLIKTLDEENGNADVADVVLKEDGGKEQHAETVIINEEHENKKIDTKHNSNEVNSGTKADGLQVIGKESTKEDCTTENNETPFPDNDKKGDGVRQDKADIEMKEEHDNTGSHRYEDFSSKEHPEKSSQDSNKTENDEGRGNLKKTESRDGIVADTNQHVEKLESETSSVDAEVSPNTNINDGMSSESSTEDKVIVSEIKNKEPNIIEDGIVITDKKDIDGISDTKESEIVNNGYKVVVQDAPKITSLQEDAPKATTSTIKDCLILDDKNQNKPDQSNYERNEVRREKRDVENEEDNDYNDNNSPNLGKDNVLNETENGATSDVINNVDSHENSKIKTHMSTIKELDEKSEDNIKKDQSSYNMKDGVSPKKETNETFFSGNEKSDVVQDNLDDEMKKGDHVSDQKTSTETVVNDNIKENNIKMNTLSDSGSKQPSVLLNDSFEELREINEETDQESSKDTKQNSLSDENKADTSNIIADDMIKTRDVATTNFDDYIAGAGCNVLKDNTNHSDSEINSEVHNCKQEDNKNSIKEDIISKDHLQDSNDNTASSNETLSDNKKLNTNKNSNEVSSKDKPNNVQVSTMKSIKEDITSKDHLPESKDNTASSNETLSDNKKINTKKNLNDVSSEDKPDDVQVSTMKSIKEDIISKDYLQNSNDNTASSNETLSDNKKINTKENSNKVSSEDTLDDVQASAMNSIKEDITSKEHLQESNDNTASSNQTLSDNKKINTKENSNEVSSEDKPDDVQVSTMKSVKEDITSKEHLQKSTDNTASSNETLSGNKKINTKENSNEVSSEDKPDDVQVSTMKSVNEDITSKEHLQKSTNNTASSNETLSDNKKINTKENSNEVSSEDKLDDVKVSGIKSIKEDFTSKEHLQESNDNTASSDETLSDNKKINTNEHSNEVISEDKAEDVQASAMKSTKEDLTSKEHLQESNHNTASSKETLPDNKKINTKDNSNEVSSEDKSDDAKVSTMKNIKEDITSKEHLQESNDNTVSSNETLSDNMKINTKENLNEVTSEDKPGDVQASTMKSIKEDITSQDHLPEPNDNTASSNETLSDNNKIYTKEHSNEVSSEDKLDDVKVSGMKSVKEDIITKDRLQESNDNTASSNETLSGNKKINTKENSNEVSSEDKPADVKMSAMHSIKEDFTSKEHLQESNDNTVSSNETLSDNMKINTKENLNEVISEDKPDDVQESAMKSIKEVFTSKEHLQESNDNTASSNETLSDNKKINTKDNSNEVNSEDKLDDVQVSAMNSIKEDTTLKDHLQASNDNTASSNVTLSDNKKINIKESANEVSSEDKPDDESNDNTASSNKTLSDNKKINTKENSNKVCSEDKLDDVKVSAMNSIKEDITSKDHIPESNDNTASSNETLSDKKINTKENSNEVSSEDKPDDVKVSAMNTIKEDFTSKEHLQESSDNTASSDETLSDNKKIITKENFNEVFSEDKPDDVQGSPMKSMKEDITSKEHLQASNDNTASSDETLSDNKKINVKENSNEVSSEHKPDDVQRSAMKSMKEDITSNEHLQASNDNTASSNETLSDNKKNNVKENSNEVTSEDKPDVVPGSAMKSIKEDIASKDHVRESNGNTASSNETLSDNKKINIKENSNEVSSEDKPDDVQESAINSIKEDITSKDHLQESNDNTASSNATLSDNKKINIKEISNEVTSEDKPDDVQESAMKNIKEDITSKEQLQESNDNTASSNETLSEKKINTKENSNEVSSEDKPDDVQGYAMMSIKEDITSKDDLPESNDNTASSNKTLSDNKKINIKENSNKVSSEDKPDDVQVSAMESIKEDFTSNEHLHESNDNTASDITKSKTLDDGSKAELQDTTKMTSLQENAPRDATSAIVLDEINDDKNQSKPDRSNDEIKHTESVETKLENNDTSFPGNERNDKVSLGKMKDEHAQENIQEVSKNIEIKKDTVDDHATIIHKNENKPRNDVDINEEYESMISAVKNLKDENNDKNKNKDDITNREIKSAESLMSNNLSYGMVQPGVVSNHLSELRETGREKHNLENKITNLATRELKNSEKVDKEGQNITEQLVENIADSVNTIKNDLANTLDKENIITDVNADIFKEAHETTEDSTTKEQIKAPNQENNKIPLHNNDKKDDGVRQDKVDIEIKEEHANTEPNRNEDFSSKDDPEKSSLKSNKAENDSEYGNLKRTASRDATVSDTIQHVKDMESKTSSVDAETLPNININEGKSSASLVITDITDTKKKDDVAHKKDDKVIVSEIKEKEIHVSDGDKEKISNLQNISEISSNIIEDETIIGVEKVNDDISDTKKSDIVDDGSKVEVQDAAKITPPQDNVPQAVTSTLKDLDETTDDKKQNEPDLSNYGTKGIESVETKLENKSHDEVIQEKRDLIMKGEEVDIDRTGGSPKGNSYKESVSNEIENAPRNDIHVNKNESHENIATKITSNEVNAPKNVIETQLIDVTSTNEDTGKGSDKTNQSKPDETKNIDGVEQKQENNGALFPEHDKSDKVPRGKREVGIKGEHDDGTTVKSAESLASKQENNDTVFPGNEQKNNRLGQHEIDVDIKEDIVGKTDISEDRTGNAQKDAEEIEIQDKSNLNTNLQHLDPSRDGSKQTSSHGNGGLTKPTSEQHYNDQTDDKKDVITEIDDKENIGNKIHTEKKSEVIGDSKIGDIGDDNSQNSGNLKNNVHPLEVSIDNDMGKNKIVKDDDEERITQSSNEKVMPKNDTAEPKAISTIKEKEKLLDNTPLPHDQDKDETKTTDISDGQGAEVERSYGTTNGPRNITLMKTQENQLKTTDNKDMNGIDLNQSTVVVKTTGFNVQNHSNQNGTAKDIPENIQTKRANGTQNTQNKSEPFYLHQENLPYKVPATSQERAFSEILKLSFDNEKLTEERATSKKKEIYDSIPVKGNLGSSRSSMDEPKQLTQHVSEGIQCNLPQETLQPGSTVLVQASNDQDGIVPVAVQMNQVPGAALVTSDPGSRETNGDALDYSATSVDSATPTHAHRDASESENAPRALPVSNGKFTCAEADVVMETAKRNNSTIVKKTMEQEAATKIQASFRGYQVRKQLKNKLAGDNITSIKRTSRRKSLGRVMDNNKNTSNKDPSPLEEVSATKIQAGVRGFLVRRRQQKTKSTPESP